MTNDQWLKDTIEPVLRGSRKSGLIRQVSSSKRFNSYEIFYDRTRKRWSLNTGDHMGMFDCMYYFSYVLTNLFVVGCAIIVTGTINTARKNANDIFIRAMENNTSDWNISPILFNSSQSNINLLSADWDFLKIKINTVNSLLFKAYQFS